MNYKLVSPAFQGQDHWGWASCSLGLESTGSKDREMSFNWLLNADTQRQEALRGVCCMPVSFNLGRARRQ